MNISILLVRFLVILFYVHLEIVHSETEATVINSAVCEKPIDLVFAIDVTSSINEPKRLDMLYFIENVVQGFNISNLKTHVAVLTFNNKITIFTELTAEKETFNKVMLKLQYLQPKGLAFTHLALKKADSIFTNGSRNSTSTKALVLLTDSSCNNKQECPVPVENVARQLNAVGIDIFAVSLSKTSVKEMAAIGSQPGNMHIHVNNYKALRNSRLTVDFRNLICAAPVCSCYNLTDCNKEIVRCKRIPACDHKYYFRVGIPNYTVCCNDNGVCESGFKCDESKKECVAEYTVARSTKLAIPHNNLTPSSSTSASHPTNPMPAFTNLKLIAGVVAAALIIFIVLPLLIFFFRRYKKEKISTKRPDERDYPGGNINRQDKRPQEAAQYEETGISMRAIQTAKCAVLHDMNRVDCRDQSSNCMNHVIQSSYYMNQSNVENKSYASLQGSDWSRNDYQQLEGMYRGILASKNMNQTNLRTEEEYQHAPSYIQMYSIPYANLNLPCTNDGDEVPRSSKYVNQPNKLPKYTI